MGWCTHRIRLALESPNPLDRAAVARELDALDAARALLTERLSAELTAPTPDDPSGAASASERPTAASAWAPPTTVAIDDLVDTIVGVLRPKAAKLGLRLEFEQVDKGAERGSPRGRPDTARHVPEALHEALFNLLDNAIDAAEASVRVVLTDTGSGTCSIAVIDDGAGLSVAEPRAFEPFVTTKPMGTGMGLAIAEAVVGDAGGHLTYRRANGRTSFTIELPDP